jgi:hypothetical protein
MNRRPNWSAGERENEGENDPSGAGAAPGRQDHQPRAQSGRGEVGSGSKEFFGFLSRSLSTRQPNAVAPANRIGPASWTTVTAHTIGEFRGQARWIVARSSTIESTEMERLRDTGIDGEDNELGAILSAIAEEVQRVAAAASDGVVAEFAGRMRHARNSLPRGQIPAVLQVLKDARDAALALIKRNAAAELASRREAAIGMRGKPSRNVGTAPPSVSGNRPKWLDRK